MTILDGDSGMCGQWTTAGAVCSMAPDLPTDDDTVADAIAMASEVLFNFTRRRWPGLCTDTVRPCLRSDCVQTAADLRALVNGDPLPVSHLTSDRECGCGYLPSWDLPGRPAVEILEVKVDGHVVPPSDYALDNEATLVGQRMANGHTRTWPSCQRLDVDDTHPGTWSVSYTYGFAPPAGGRRAATSLAIQLAYAWTPTGKDKTRLPKRVTTVSRQNVTMALIDPLTLFADGMTGLPEVDMWVAAANRGSNMRGAAVIDPMVGRSARRRD